MTEEGNHEDNTWKFIENTMKNYLNQLFIMGEYVLDYIVRLTLSDDLLWYSEYLIIVSQTHFCHENAGLCSLM